MFFQPRPQLRIQCLQSADFLKAHTVGRIGHHNAAHAVRTDGLRVGNAEGNDVVHPGTACVGQCRLNDAAVAVAARNRCKSRFNLRFGTAAQIRPQRFIEILQFFKTETAHHTRRAAGGNPSGFDSNRAAAAKRVLKRLRAVVACREQQSGGKVFAQRGFAGIETVAAFEQGFARSVDEDFDIAFVQKGVDANIGRGFVHARTCVVNVAESVADGIFDGQSDKLEAFDVGTLCLDFDFERLLQGKPVEPVDVFGKFVNVALGSVCAFGQA
ncbi:Uncharacterised protein [Neisseria meningitidis]|nr:Uncharacterised protein [Neisseria meningitidis]